MIYNHDTKKRPKQVAEPVQVYLDPDQQARLERLAAQLDTTKSGVLRLALEALEREVANPDLHPALQLIGLADLDMPRYPHVDADPARDHDTVLADNEVSSWDDLSSSAGG